MIAKRSWVCQRGIRRLRNYSAEGIATVEPTEYIPQKLPHKFTMRPPRRTVCVEDFSHKICEGALRADSKQILGGGGALIAPNQKRQRQRDQTNKQTKIKQTIACNCSALRNKQQRFQNARQQRLNRASF